MPAKIARMVTFTARQYVWLRKEAQRLGISIADLVRRCIDEVRDKRH